MSYSEKDFQHDLLTGDHIKDAERFAAFYEHLGLGDVQRKQQVVKGRIHLLKLCKGTVLELGCHVGFNLIYLATRGHNVVGVDISSSLLEAAEMRINELEEDIKNRIQLIHSDILELNLNEKFDTILLTETLEHVINHNAVLRKAVQFMHQGSRLIISAPKQRVGNYSHVRGITEKWVKKAGKELGITFTFFEHRFQTQAIGVFK